MENESNTLTNSNPAGDIAEGVQQTKDKAAKAVRNLVGTLDSQRERVADGLSKTASAVQHSGERVAGLAESAAESLGSTSDYLRRNGLGSIMSDTFKAVRKNPASLLLAAVILGFALGRAWTSRNG